MRYPERLKVTRPAAGGTQDPATGAWTPPAATVLYDGAADVQDDGVVVERDSAGRPVRRSDAVAYLADESGIPQIAVGDVATVTWADATTSDARVSRVTRLDGSLSLEWV